MKNIQVKTITRIGMIAALYVAVTVLLAPISFGPVQFRVAEAMTLLPILWIESIPGVFIGCFLSNLFFGYGILDAVVGGFATLVAAVLTYRLRKNIWLAALPPVLVNAVVIGLMLYYVDNAPLLLTMGTVGAGQVGACYVLGIPLIFALRRVAHKL